MLIAINFSNIILATDFDKQSHTIRIDAFYKGKPSVNVLAVAKNQLEAWQCLRAIKKVYMKENNITDASEIKVQKIKNRTSYSLILQHNKHLTWKIQAFVDSADQLESRVKAIVEQRDHDIDLK